MSRTVIFDPLIPLPLIWGLGALALVLLAFAIWRGLRGWPLRGLAMLALGLALVNPSLQEENRKPLSDIILAVVDETLRMRDLHAIRARGFARNVLSLLRNRTYLGYGVTMVFAFGTFFAFLFASPFVFIEVLGVKTEHFAYLITVQVVGFVSGTLLADRFMHRIGLERLFGYALALACLAGIGVALPPWLGLASVATIIAPMTVFAF